MSERDTYSLFSFRDWALIRRLSNRIDAYEADDIEPRPEEEVLTESQLEILRRFRAEMALHHPDDDTLTVQNALEVLNKQDHQRIAALVEWLAARVIEAADREDACPGSGRATS